MTNSRSDKPEVEEQDEQIVLDNENSSAMSDEHDDDGDLDGSDSDLDQLCLSVESEYNQISGKMDELMGLMDELQQRNDFIFKQAKDLLLEIRSTKEENN